jgi:hypothetical protein
MATCNHGVALADTTNTTSYTTASFGIVINELIIVFVGKTASIVDGTVTDSLGGTYVQAHIVNKSAGSDEAQAFVRTTLTASTTSMTVNYDCTGDAATGCIIMVVRVNGVTRTGASAIRQFGGQNAQAGGTTPAPSFPAACLTGNPTIGFVNNETNPAGMTAPASWTELTADVGHSQPAAGGEYVIRNSGFTGTTITWGSTSASEYCDIILEIDTSAESTRRVFLIT